jgi:hypothetical protein
VDCDRYEEFINFPAFWNKPNYDGILPIGTPLVQAIPIHRSSFQIEEDLHPFTENEIKVIDKANKSRQIHRSFYRDKLWVRK